MPVFAFACPVDRSSESAVGRAWLATPDGKKVVLTRGLFSIGRNPEHSLCIPDSYVSGSHAIIEVQADGSHCLTDLRSRNGTFVNGRRISAPTRVRNGDRIQVGSNELVFVCIEQRADFAAEKGTTAIQIYEGPAWIFIADLIGFSTRRQSMGGLEAEQLTQSWASQLAQVIDQHGGTVNAQAGDALLFYWRGSLESPGDAWLTGFFEGVFRLQQAWEQRAPFRIVCHYGAIRVSTDATRNELLSGPPVDFTFRLEKGAKELGTDVGISEPAAVRIADRISLRALGQVQLPSFPGKHWLFGPS